MTETRAVAGAAQGESETAETPTPACWLDQPRHGAEQALETWLPGLTRHQQTDKWLRGEAAHDRGPRGPIAARIVERWAALVGCEPLLHDEASLRALLQLEAAGPARPAAIAGLNALVADCPPEPEPTAAVDPDSSTPDTAAVADGGERGVCEDCGTDMRPDEIADQPLWWCPNCEDGTTREVVDA